MYNFKFCGKNINFFFKLALKIIILKAFRNKMYFKEVKHYIKLHINISNIILILST